MDVNALESEKDKKYWTKRFQQEISILKEAQTHPSVCRLLETFKINGKTVLVLENIEGGSIKKWLKLNAPVSLEQKIAFLSQILKVYAFFHKKGILHGDIHRSNILIANDLSTEVSTQKIKIIDFDMSYHQPLRKDELVIEGGVEGYLPPENISNDYFDTVKKCANFRSEVYQLGVIAYTIFYEKMPFEAAKWKDLAKMIRESPPELGLFTENTEGGIDSFLSQCLAKNPKKRFISAIQMNDYWQQWLKKC